MSNKKLNIINWKNILKHSENFQKNNPKWAFIEDVFDSSFYDELYKTYPKLDDTWAKKDSFDKNGYVRNWNNQKNDEVVINSKDELLSEYWNIFYNYLFSNEFISNIQKFSNIKINRVKYFSFGLLTQGGFQLPHIHNVGPNTIIMMMYFSKGWEKNDPGGTYVSTTEDLSNLVFEPYNLENSMIIFHDGPMSGHGVRPIKKDVERRAIQVYLEEYNEIDGWSGDKHVESNLVEL